MAEDSEVITRIDKKLGEHYVKNKMTNIYFDDGQTDQPGLFAVQCEVECGMVLLWTSSVTSVI